MDDMSKNIYINVMGLVLVCISLLLFKCTLRYVIPIFYDEIIVFILLVLLLFFIYKVGKYFVLHYQNKEYDDIE